MTSQVRSFKSGWAFLAYLSFCSPLVFSQQTAATQQPGAADSKKPDAATPESTQTSGTKAEISIQEQGTTFRLNVNLVQVHVTVRDTNGKAVANLRKDDFLLYDQGKLQQVSTFAVETRESRQEKGQTAEKTGGQPEGPASSALPDRFIALVFDDAHVSLQDANYLRTQVLKFLDHMAPTDRVGIFSSSGQLSHDFTSDKEALRETLMGLVPRPRFATGQHGCPDISYYEADQIVNFRNAAVIDAVVQATMSCLFGDTPSTQPGVAVQQRNQATFTVNATAPQVLSQGDVEAQFVYRYMTEVLRRLAGMPGERVMILASPGFLMTTQHLEMSAVIDRANRSNIVINTLDARGLYVADLGGDISELTSVDPSAAGPIASYQVAAQRDQSYVLLDFAYGTGGVYYGNSNDLAAGLEQLAAAPEVSYVLGFSPQNQKMDGTFHALKVGLVQKNKGTIQARRGYWVPRRLDDPAQQEHQEIVAAVFSRDEILDLPVQIQTQYFKGDAASARLSVVSRIDLKGMRFRKAEGWILDNLTVATVIFDDNGNYVSGLQKVVQLKLQDPTYQQLLRTGLRVKSDFDVKPGRYMVRQVVRDSEGSQMAARNGSVEIPN